MANLVAAGFEVIGARTFLEVVWCLASDSVDLFVIYMPEAQWAGNAIITEMHRARPRLPIVALVPTVTEQLERLLVRLHVATLLPASCDGHALAAAIHRELSAAGAASK